MGSYYDGCMSAYKEERTFTITVSLSAEFGDDYEGDDDGYVWLEQWRQRVQPKLVAAAFDALRSDARFVAIPVSRGKNPEDHLDIDVRWKS